jgi:hypothetical protein
MKTLLASVATLLLIAHAGAASAGSVTWDSGISLAGMSDYSTVQSWEDNFLRRKMGVYVSFLPHATVSGSTSQIRSKLGFFRSLSSNGTRIVQVVPLLMEGHNPDSVINGSLRNQYIAFWRQIGSTLAEAGARAPVVRIGHEMNLGCVYNWSAVCPGMNEAKFVALYRMAADAIRSTKPDAQRCWNPGKASQTNIQELWPGDNYVDLIGVDWYNNGNMGGFITDDASWKKKYSMGSVTDPIGLGRWYEFAKAHNKPISFPEWGVSDNRGVIADHPAFIRNMYNYFQMIDREGNLAFESYYNATKHQIVPVRQHPNASRTYQSLFGN